MKQKLNLLFILLFLTNQIAFSQTIEKSKKNEISVELKKSAVELLRETSSDVGNLQSLENRISFSAELAALMWFHDEKEARAMFQTVINDFRNILAQYDTQLGVADFTIEESDYYSNEKSDKAKFIRRLTKALSVRQQIAMTIAEHDPKLALEFFTESGQAISNPGFRKQMESRDSYFETRLLNEIAAKDVDTALKYGRKLLSKGFNGELVGVLEKIYAKDAEKGATFGEEIVQKIKSDDNAPDKLYYLGSLLNLGDSNLQEIKQKSDKKPLFTEQTMRDLAELMAQAILKREVGEGSGLEHYIPQIEKFAPARAAQIRQKFGIKKETEKTKNIADGGPKTNPKVRKSEESDEKQLSEDVGKLGKKELSKEERERIVGQARKVIAEIKDPMQKLVALSTLAANVAASGDKEFATQIMNEARTFVNPQPKNYQDFILIWMLAGGYAPIDADKSFPLIEDAIFRLNETIAAFIKVGEFIDVNDEIIENGEVQVGGFGGAITRDLTRNLKQADATIRNLAIADFVRTKGLTNKFDRQEVRILAKMLVLRSVLGERKAEDGESKIDVKMEDF